ncbi:hypothetical protein [Nesterenkonia muleiensis]|uniref:hypothetical protein n=1 Tax=Nesterenkonia muleiensis TaxID=2282648 RepID=UPI00192E7330|nr:hypothetical protein [Nesterenkonia muleiensis]
MKSSAQFQDLPGMSRISVVGSSGSGKSAVAQRLSEILGVPHIELDALFWGPNWSEATSEELREKVQQATQDDEAWVVDGNYQGKLGTLVWQQADTVVWVNPSRGRVMWQSFSRTVHRAMTGQELWNGNRENWRGLMFWRGDESILRWAWSSYPRVQKRYEEAMADPQNERLTFYRLRSRKEINRFMTALASDSVATDGQPAS